MHTIPELTGERGTASRSHSVEVGSGDYRNGPMVVSGGRRLSSTLPGLTVLNDTASASGLDSTRDAASKTISG